MSSHGSARWLALVLALVGGTTLGLPVRAGDPPPPTVPPPTVPPPIGAVAAAAAAAAAREKLSLLKDRVSEWCRARQDLKINCVNCNGSGAITVGRVHKQCPSCVGVGRTISRVRFIQINYDMFSPEYRKSESAKPAAEALWVEIRKDVKGFRNLGSYRLDGLRLIDDRHAFALTYENGEGVPHDLRWIYATEPATHKSTWYFWHEAADGPWPDPATAPGTASVAAPTPVPPRKATGAGASPGVPPPSSVPDPVPSARAMDEKLRVAIVGALASAKVAHTIEKVSGDSSIAVVTLSRGRALSRLQWKALVDADVVATARAAFTVKGFDALHVVITVPAKSAFGAIENRPRTSFDMQRETFSKIDFANLTLSEAIRLFAIDRLSLGEWTTVESDPKPDALSLDQDNSVAKALAGANPKLQHKIRAFGRYADVLVVKLALASVADEDASEASAGAAAVAGALAILPSLKEWAGVRFEFALPYRDSFGKVEEHVHYVAHLAREKFEKLKVENLTVAEIFTHFEIDRPVLTGLVYWPK